MINSRLEQRDNSMAYTFLAANGAVIPSHNSAGKFLPCCQVGMSSTRHTQKKSIFKNDMNWVFILFEDLEMRSKQTRNENACYGKLNIFIQLKDSDRLNIPLTGCTCLVPKQKMLITSLALLLCTQITFEL